MAPRVFIVAAKRTPFGSFLGSLSHLTATELGVLASRAALSQLPDDVSVDSCIFGNVLQTSVCAPYLARHIALYSGLDVSLPALTVNRLCGSGFQSIINGFQEIALNKAQMVLCGGTENMSMAPHILRNSRKPSPYGKNMVLEDSLATSLVDRYNGETPMGITAENLATKFSISRKESDEHALLSQRRWNNANESGIFKDEIIPVDITIKKKNIRFDKDEHPKPKTSIDDLTKLRAVFKKEGVVTAGNASGISDGAAAVILTNEKVVEKYKLKPLAEITAYSTVGCEPSTMGYGPVPAIRKLLKETKMEVKDFDLVEINEAFAPQFLAVQRDLGLDMDKTNINGGAIAIGHPLGASGTRIIAHLAHLMKKMNKETAIGSACIGGGQGIAVSLKKV